MKNLFLILLYLTVSLSASSQTQQGYVKTRGRLVNGNVVAGQRLSGVTVQIKGRNAVVSKANGTFSFHVPANRFVVQSVKKQGYVLVDPEVTARQYTYSSNPLILVLETPNQLTEDKLANERKIRRTLQRQLEAKEDEIEAIKEQNKITEEEYHKALQKLYALQENNEKLISDMAERYSQIDYDQLDEFNQRISDCILNGRLTEADSLLRSKGDMKSRIASILQEEEIEAAEAAELAQRQENLEKSKAGTKASKEDAARDCYSFYERFLTEHQNDSAAYYLKLRASLDSTNVEWLQQAGIFIKDYLADYSQALSYYMRGLHQAEIQYGEDSEWVATFYNSIGILYDNKGEYNKALEFHFKALSIREKIFGSEHPTTANSYNNIGISYDNQRDYNKSLEFLYKALSIREKLFGSEHLATAITYNNLGVLFNEQGQYLRALEYHLKSLDIKRNLLGINHIDIATSYNNIGTIYTDQGEYDKALDYHFKALEIRRHFLEINHIDIATSYHNIGTVFHLQGNYIKALEYLLKALDIKEKLLGNEHPSTADTYLNVGWAYEELNDHNKALHYFKIALSSFATKFGNNSDDVMTVMKAIDIAEYGIALSSGELEGFLLNHCIVFIIDKMGPAHQLGMFGEYILLKYNDWQEYDNMSIYDKVHESRGKLKDVIVFKDGVIAKYHFEDKIGAKLSIKHITKEERQLINQLYNQWKRENKD